MTPDILCLGEPMLEFNQKPDGNYLPGHGGDTSNAAIAAARQGARVGMITHLGTDAFGQSFLDLWASEGVDTTSVRQVTDAHTGVYFVTHGPDGHEFSYLRAGSAASRMGPGDLPVTALQQAKILHVSGISQAISDTAADAVFEAIRLVREGGGRVSYDTNLRLKLWPLERARAVTHAAMAQCDIALPGLEDAVQLTGLEAPEDIVQFYLDLGPSIVALTLGSKGTLVATSEKQSIVPVREVKAVDATAAGDTFDGTFLARLVAGDDPFEAARYANAAAALTTLGYGAVAPMPRKEAVTEFLAQEAV
ncbi:sugar kinase [Paracoccus homiensis]|uniref:2-keto-3-deoxygluconate kinase n=1 Tax=Paracoccus homiensis TaxID=364199 RepID=A0A1I0IMH4_9RHOB|nr:sugar kinase [Paracoccus homiensis]SET97572.1 2-keto-3-deoxygluconate kinase [Paracoccus homiensis]